MKENQPTEIQSSSGVLESELKTRAVPGIKSTLISAHWWKIPLLFVSIFLFALGISLMKEGAAGLEPLVTRILKVDSPLNSLGFGWLGAYLLMSGSPVAASALTLLENGVLDRISTFTMITGSRLGAGFIVLLMGFIYILRGRDRSTNLGMGILSLLVTFSTYLLGLFIGIFILNHGLLDSVQLGGGGAINSFMDMLFTPILKVVLNFLPLWIVFLLGLAVIITSLQLFDKCLPVNTLKESQLGKTARLVYQPWVMFLLGAGITLISMSVSVSLSILIPLSNRGFVRRENVVPYIMGANITTFIDTLFASLLVNNPDAATIVLTSMLSITIVSILILLTSLRFYETTLLHLVNKLTRNNKYLAVFLVIIFLTPLFLLFV